MRYYFYMKPIVFTPTSARQWVKLAPDVRSRIDRRLTEFATTGHGDVKRLKGRDGTRLRVGDWRVIFYEEQGSIVIAAVGHRRDIYD
jgi:mRNA interferase RelE/StbE